MIFKSILISTLFSVAAHAATDAKSLQFTGEILSQTPYRLKFAAPAGHHFNAEAPAKVEVLNGTESAKGTLEKSPQTMTVAFAAPPKSGAACTVTAQLYVCNDDNTYCQPIREQFDCAKLTPKM